MSAAGRPVHRKTGAALGYHGDVVELTMRCHACQTIQTEVVNGDASVREALAGITCLFCARVGMMRMVKG